MHTPQLADNLRRALLQAAIEGKLSERQADDGHAQDLLKQIQAEKAALVKAGRLKKSKGLPEIGEDEKPFAIPENWVWVRLGEIVINRDAERIPLSKADREKREKIFDYYGASGVIDKVDDYLFDEPLLLVGEDGANLITRSKPIAFIAIGKYWVNNHAHVLQPLINTEYLMYYINAIDLYPYVTGTAQPKMNQEKMNTILVSIPPLAEQARIVAKLDALLAETDALKAQESALADAQKNFPKMLRASLLQAAIEGKLTERQSDDGHAQELLEQIQAEKAAQIQAGRLKKSKGLPEISEDEKPFAIPENWVWVRLGEIGETNIGLTYDKKDISSEGTIVLRSGNIQNDKIDLSDVVKINSDIPLNKMCQKGDILICARNGSKSLVGKAAIINEEGLSFGAFMAIFRSPFNPYVFYYLHSPLFRSAFDGVGTTTINQITQDNLRNRLIPLPPLAEQARIVAKLDALLAQIESLENLS